MIETVHTIAIIRTPPPEHQTTRDRLERARALVIAQFGETVLVDPRNHRFRSAPAYKVRAQGG